MTRAPATDLLREAIAASETILRSLERLAADQRLGLPVTAQRLAALDEDDAVRIQGFLRLFEQLHQLVERKLFRGLLLLSGEDVEALSVRNMVDRLEKLGATGNAEVWRMIGKVRNNLAHDYPTNIELHTERVNEAFAALPALGDAARTAIAYIQRQQLLD